MGGKASRGSSEYVARSIPLARVEARACIVILDAEGSIASRAETILSRRSYKCEIRRSLRDAEAAVHENAASVLVCNAIIPAFDVSLLSSLRERHSTIGVLLVGLDPRIWDQSAASPDSRIMYLPAKFDEKELASSVSQAG